MLHQIIYHQVQKMTIYGHIVIGFKKAIMIYQIQSLMYFSGLHMILCMEEIIQKLAHMVVEIQDIVILIPTHISMKWAIYSD